jgi:hypothetical protein
MNRLNSSSRTPMHDEEDAVLDEYPTVTPMHDEQDAVLDEYPTVTPTHFWIGDGAVVGPHFSCLVTF